MRFLRVITYPLLACIVFLWMNQQAICAEKNDFAEKETHTVFMLTFRGCEEICSAFKQYLNEKNLKITYIDRNVDYNISRVGEFIKEIREVKPDLVVTWGTGVTLGVVGPYDSVDNQRYIKDIPVVYLNVGDPVGSKIAINAQKSGRKNVAGGNVDPPLITQVRAIEAYKPIKRIGVIYGTNEVNSVLNVNQLKSVLDLEKIELVQATLPLGENGFPLDTSIETAVKEISRKKPDFIYYVASSYILKNIKNFSNLLIKEKLPLFSAYEIPLREGNALYGIPATNANIGQIGAYQAHQILEKHKVPGDLPTVTLSTFNPIVNIRVAREIGLLPPPSILNYAETIDH